VAFFATTQAQNHIRLFIKTDDERKEGKDFETFLSLFFPLFDTNTTTLARTQRQRRRTRPVFLFFFLPRVVKFYIEKDSKKRRAIDFDCFAHHPEAAAKNPKLTKKRLFITHVNISLSLSIDRYSAECVALSLSTTATEHVFFFSRAGGPDAAERRRAGSGNISSSRRTTATAIGWFVVIGISTTTTTRRWSSECSANTIVARWTSAAATTAAAAAATSAAATTQQRSWRAKRHGWRTRPWG